MQARPLGMFGVDAQGGGSSGALASTASGGRPALLPLPRTRAVELHRAGHGLLALRLSRQGSGRVESGGGRRTVQSRWAAAGSGGRRGGRRALARDQEGPTSFKSRLSAGIGIAHPGSGAGAAASAGQGAHSQSGGHGGLSGARGAYRAKMGADAGGGPLMRGPRRLACTRCRCGECSNCAANFLQAGKAVLADWIRRPWPQNDAVSPRLPLPACLPPNPRYCPLSSWPRDAATACPVPRPSPPLSALLDTVLAWLT